LKVSDETYYSQCIREPKSIINVLTHTFVTRMTTATARIIRKHELKKQHTTISSFEQKLWDMHWVQMYVFPALDFLMQWFQNNNLSAK